MYGLSNTLHNNIIQTSDVQDPLLSRKIPIKRLSLSKIKSEFVNRYKISNDVLVDAQAAKNVLDNIAEPCNYIKGFIQEISAVPFGFILLSEIQVLNIF